MWIPKGEALIRRRRLFKTRRLLEEIRYYGLICELLSLISRDNIKIIVIRYFLLIKIIQNIFNIQQLLREKQLTRWKATLSIRL